MKHLATLSSQETMTGDTLTKELNLISFNDDRPRYDLRTWKRTVDGETAMMKGVTLTEFEIPALVDALNKEYPVISATIKEECDYT